MKKIIKLMYLLMFANVLACTDEDLNDVQISSLNSVNNKEQSSDIQFDAIFSNQKLLDELSIKTRDASVIKYPDFYGGSYITEDGKLEIFIKGGINEARKKVSQIINDKNVVYKPCIYSFNELNSILYEIGCYLINIPSIVDKNITGAAIIDGENKINVYVKELDKQTINDFKSMFGSPAINFVKAEKSEQESTQLNAGGRANINMAGDKYGSFAFRAVENSGQKRKGMVTAGHVVDEGGLIYNNSVVVGTCSKSIQVGSVDAAFVPVTNSSFEPTNYIVGTYYELSNNTSQPGAGTFVNFRGATSGAQSGRIISTSAIENFDGCYYTNLTTADYTSSFGDSGGIIYTYISSQDVRYTVGVHLGVANNVKYFSKANKVLEALNISRY